MVVGEEQLTLDLGKRLEGYGWVESEWEVERCGWVESEWEVERYGWV